LRLQICESLRDCGAYDSICDSVQVFYNSNIKKSYVDVIPGVEGDVKFFFEKDVLKLSSSLFSTVYCDFTKESFIKEVQQSFGRSEGVYSFLRPISKNSKVTICDMTVGMGKDFFKFILAGHDVMGFERNPVFYHLVKNGMERFNGSSASDRLKEKFRVSDFKMNLNLGEAHFSKQDSFDLIYYDPMFEEKSKKAAPKKGMQALKCLSPWSSQDEKIKCLQEALDTNPQNLIFKSAGVDKDFPFRVKKESKGKGFSYAHL